MLIIFLFSTLVITLLICFSKSIRARKNNSVYHFSVNEQLPHLYTSLKKSIENRVQNDIYLVIIQDDIPFCDPNFYWPKRTAYVHLSDAISFLKYNTRLNSKGRYHKTTIFINTKVFMN